MSRGILRLLPLAALVALALLPGSGCGGGGGGGGPVCCNSDSPDCPCFNATGAWNPAVDVIQEVALETLGTRTSCVADGGKPYYQMRLGLNSPGEAQLFACILADPAFVIDEGWSVREAWCSESISYWHREAAFPYASGFRNSDWLLDWQLTNTNALRLYYEAEEASGGRGRWVLWSDVDYSDWRPGENAPAPGSWIYIRHYDTTDGWGGSKHSIMIDEMTVYQTLGGTVDRVRATIIEGNAGASVVNTRVIDDLVDVMPGGSSTLSGGRYVYGFGVDVDPSGDPIYDPSRLHTELVVRAEPMPVRPPDPSDLWWEAHFGPLVLPLADFAKTLRQMQGPVVATSLPNGVFQGIPDGRTVRWTFPPDLEQKAPGGFDIEIDLLGEHPLTVQRLLLTWAGTALPQGYHVRYAAADGKYQEAAVPDLPAGRVPFDQGGRALFPVPVPLGAQGARVRFVKFVFPPGSLLGVTALDEMRMQLDLGPDDDAKDV